MVTVVGQIAVTDVNDGAPGTPGDPGSPGAAGPRNSAGVVWFQTAQVASPTKPSATTINFSTGALTGLTSGWAKDVPDSSGTLSGDVAWQSAFTVSEATFGGTQTFTFGDPEATTLIATTLQSDNYVASESGWQIDRDTGDAEFGAAVIRGRLTADQIDVSQLVLTSANILTIDGSQVATRTHRRDIDDYIDDLLGVVATEGGSADGTTVEGPDATTNLRYRFSADIDSGSIPPPDNEFRIRRFYYPIVTSNNDAYTVENDLVKFFTIEDIVGALGTGFYTSNSTNDFYRAGPNNNDRTIMYEIPSPDMYLNMTEILTPIDPAIEFSSTGRVNIEMQVQADGTNTPVFTAIEMEAFAVNIEEFFTVVATSGGGTDYDFVETFEEITNVQLTPTENILAYVNTLTNSTITVSGGGTVYGVARGF